MNEILLSVRHVSKRFAHHTALDDVSLEVKRGGIFGLLGPNGAGKTTLIRIINHITLPDSGEVWFDGQPLSQNDVAYIGYLPEERGLYRKMKVGEQAMYLAQLKGLSRQEARKRLTYWFEKFHIMPWWNKKLEELSKGMQQKVQFIITIVHEPKLLIFDEPFSGFDPLNADLLKNEMIELRDKGHTIIFSTHNMASVEEICDDIALIHRSKVCLSGQVSDIRSQHRTGVFQITASSGRLLSHPECFTVLSEKKVQDLRIYHLQKTNEMSNSAMLQTIASEIEIQSFSEILPTMHEIFIRTVGHDREAFTGNVQLDTHNAPSREGE